MGLYDSKKETVARNPDVIFSITDIAELPIFKGFTGIFVFSIQPLWGGFQNEETEPFSSRRRPFGGSLFYGGSRRC
jgi:hypothetical protein